MDASMDYLEILKSLDIKTLISISVIMLSCWIVASLVRLGLRYVAEQSEPKFRLLVLRSIPLIRLLVWITGIVLMMPLIIEPTFQNIMTLIASASLVLAFIFKDYFVSIAAGVVNILENAYQVGDWIELDGSYGEVMAVNLRAVHILTSDDNEIVIPHDHLWSKKISNATSGSRSLLCIANFYLNPHHDGWWVKKYLIQVGESSPYRKPDSKISVVAEEKPWGTHYKLKAYAKESRDQFAFITDMTLRAKEGLLAEQVQFAHTWPMLALKA